MATNFVQKGETVTLTAPDGGVVSGQAVLIGSLFGVCQYDAAAGDEVEVALVGVFDLPKAAVAIAEGADVYWKTSTAQITTAGDGDYAVGAATVAAGQFAGTARVRLNGIAVSSTGSPL